MDYGGNERRKTKKDFARGYKRGGQFRTQAVDETSEDKSTGKGKKKRKGRKML